MTKRAIITGGAKPDGIGWATAMALAEDGYEVIVTGISEGEVGQSPSHASIEATVLDVRDASAIDALIGRFPSLDALVNCAGMADPASEFSPEGFARTIDVNLTGAMRCCVAAREKLAASRGAIVNVASMYAIFGSPITPGYSASKGGIVQLTKSLAVAWGPDIRVNAVAPGWIRTGMARPVWEDPTWSAVLCQRTPMSRFGEPDELADPIRFLCSDAARFITGVTLPVDGGYSCAG